MKKFLLHFFEFIAGIGIVAGAVYAYLHMTPDFNNKKSTQAQPVPIVTIAELKKENVPALLEAQGNTLANESVVLTAAAQEKVSQISFNDGDTVPAGKVLVKLDCILEETALKQAELDLAEAERELDRIRPLYEANAATQKDYDVQLTERDRAKVKVEAVKTELRDRVVVAPFSGITGKRMVSMGALVSPGTEITTLDDITLLKVDFHVPEKYLAQLIPGQKFTAESIAYPGKMFSGHIASIDVRLNSITRSVSVRGIIENSKNAENSWLLRPGMLMMLTIDLGSRDQVTVPEKAVLSLSEIQYIFIYKPETKTVSRREVILGRRANGMVEILSGAEAGEKFVDEGISKLTDGAAVQVQGEK